MSLKVTKSTEVQAYEKDESGWLLNGLQESKQDSLLTIWNAYSDNRAITEINLIKLGVNKQVLSTESLATDLIIYDTDQYIIDTTKTVSLSTGIFKIQFKNGRNTYETEPFLQDNEPVFDPDAEAYLEVIGIPNDATIFYPSTPQEITGTEFWTAVNNFTIGWKAAGLWVKSKAIYLWIGGTADTHKWNLKDSRDLDAAFRLVFSGGITHSGTGALPNGVTGFADTFLHPSVILPTDSMSLSLYSRSNTITGADIRDMGCRTNASGTLWLSPKYTFGGFVDRFLSRNSSTALADTANTDARGLFDCSKTSNTANAFKTHKNGTVQDTQNGAGNNPGDKIYIFAINITGTATHFSNRECAFAAILEGITDAESASSYTLVQTLQTALHRQV